MTSSHLGSATIPPHIFANRSVVSSVLVAALLSFGLTSHTFYLPFYFQSAKGTTAASSGLRMLPYLLSVNITELAVGTGSTLLGVFLPFMYAGTSLFTLAAGLLCTLTLDTSTAKLIGFQILAGVGVGSSMQLCATSVRAAVQKKDIPMAATLSVFAPFFGSSLGAAINQNTFRTTLKQELLGFLSELDADAVIKAGGSDFKEMTANAEHVRVMEAYNDALRIVFITASVVGGIAFVGTLCIKWRTLKTKPNPGDDSAEPSESEKMT
jgi:MFS family permease